MLYFSPYLCRTSIRPVSYTHLFQVDFKKHSAGKVTAAVELYHCIDIIFPKAVFSTYINCTDIIFSHKVQLQPVP